jgi:tRNA 2-selenouridine synthase
MTDRRITLEQALLLRDQGALLLDARSPVEFAEGTIPGAINVPLLDNEQRHQVGTVYKQQGKGVARLLGVKLVAPKIPDMIDAVLAARHDSKQPVLVFCWRGGMRSGALTNFLNLAGLPALQMLGGYKVFRRHVLDFFGAQAWGRLIVLRGLTGVGKTRLLQQLAAEGLPVLDLEALANHRGSAFGGLGLGQQPSQKQFEALLWDAMRFIPPGSYALAEGESRHIGRVALPQQVYAALQREVSLWVEASLDYRVKVILDDYPALDSLKEEFVRPLRALKERLGKEQVAAFLELLEAGDWARLVAELMVHYYDPLYRHTCPEPARRIDVPIEPEADGLLRLREAIQKILATPPG